MANRELQEWEIVQGENRLFRPDMALRNVGDRLNDLQTAIKNVPNTPLSLIHI